LRTDFSAFWRCVKETTDRARDDGDGRVGSVTSIASSTATEDSVPDLTLTREWSLSLDPLA